MEIIIYAVAYALIGAMFVKPITVHAEKIFPADFFERIRGGFNLMILFIWPIVLISGLIGWLSGTIKRWFK